MRSIATRHPSGLQIIAAPRDIMPLELLTSDQLLAIVDLAAREFGTVLVDLPTNWTNWSLSLLARSDLVLLVTELRVPSLHRARRQLDLLATRTWAISTCVSWSTGSKRACSGPLEQADVRASAGPRRLLHASPTIMRLMRPAIDRGMPIAEIKRKSALGKDIDAMDARHRRRLGLER